HYLAPAAAVACALAMHLLRRLYFASPILGIAVAVLFLANSIASFAVALPAGAMEAKRIAIAHALLSQGGRHLIVVAPDVFDAVYNGAYLGRQRIVWARDLGAAANARLLDYYRGRRVWRLERGGLRTW